MKKFAHLVVANGCVFILDFSATTNMDMSGGGVAYDYVLQCIPKDLLQLAFLVTHVDSIAMLLWPSICVGQYHDI